MTFDFASMSVGDERELPIVGPWDDVRSIYEDCLAYTATLDPHPQFEFDRMAERTRNGQERWVIRRTR